MAILAAILSVVKLLRECATANISFAFFNPPKSNASVPNPFNWFKFFMNAVNPTPTPIVPNKPSFSVIVSTTSNIEVKPEIIALISSFLNKFWKMPVHVSFSAFNLYSKDFVMVDISASALPALLLISDIAFSAAEKLSKRAAPTEALFLPNSFSKSCCCSFAPSSS